MRKCNHLYKLLNEYKNVLDSRPLLFTDVYNTLNQRNYFKDHRHDQSVFSLIRKIYGSVVVVNNADGFQVENKYLQSHHKVVQQNNTYAICLDDNAPFWATRLRQ